MINCVVFDLDNTLWLPNKTPMVNTERANALRPYLLTLRNDGYFLAVASFNDEAQRVIDSLFPNTFDLVVEAQHPDDALSHNKLPMLQQIRKTYRRYMRRIGRHTKLKWTEMIFFDDSYDVINRIRVERPTLTVCEVNGKTGITKRSIEAHLKSQ